MMGKQKLSTELLELGLFSALGTTEGTIRQIMAGEGNLVGRRTPHTYGTNNGMAVIYDELGRPWIRNSGTDWEDVLDYLSEFKLTVGAYVPHSNDGGTFKRRLEEALQVRI